MVIHHLQEALLDIIDLNLCQEELKAAVSDYLAELLEAGPVYLEVEKYPEKHRQQSSPGKMLKQAGSLLKQCPPQQQSIARSRLNFPFTGQDPRVSVMPEEATTYKSPQKLPLKLSVTPPPAFTPKPNLRHQSDPVTRVYQKPQVDYNKHAFSHSAGLSHPEQTFNMTRRGDSVRRNLFSSKRVDCYHLNKKPDSVTFIKSLSPCQNPTIKQENYVMSDYIEEFEKYIQHKYSSPECIHSKDTDNQRIRSPLSSGGDEEMPDCVMGGNQSTDDSSGKDDNSPKSGNVFSCPPSRFELFLQKSSMKMESPAEIPGQQQPPKNAQPEPSNRDQKFESCENDESVGLREKVSENQQSFRNSRFEKFLRNYEAPQASSDSGETMTEEEFYRELLRIRSPKKS